jgi:glycosyltransferase involved in cell wall biosynthesis
MSDQAPASPAELLELTVILPVFNEVENLPILWPELIGVLDAHWRHVEIIFVDDVSTDGSTEWIRELARQDGRVRHVRFARHAGLTAALDAGYHRARAPIVVTMDSDLQSDPADIPQLVAALADADAATGWRVHRHDTWLKRLSSRVANFIRNRVTQETVRDSACTLRAMKRACTAALPPYDGLHRFVPTLLRIAGHRVVEIPVTHRARRFGESKFGVRNRAGRAFRDLLFVRWMQHRVLRYAIEPPSEEARPTGTEFAPPRPRWAGQEREARREGVPYGR